MYSLSRKSKFIITTMTIISLALVSGCGQKTDASVVDQPAVTSVQAETGIEEDEQDEIIPEVEEEITPVVELPEEDKYPGATVVQTSDNHYTLYVDCPDNSEADVMEQVAVLPEYAGFYYGSGNTGMSGDMAAAITAYGVEIGASDTLQINYAAWEDRVITYCDPWGGENKFPKVVVTNNPNNYINDDYNVFDESSVYSDVVATVILRNCLSYCKRKLASKLLQISS